MCIRARSSGYRIPLTIKLFNVFTTIFFLTSLIQKTTSHLLDDLLDFGSIDVVRLMDNLWLNYRLHERLHKWLHNRCRNDAVRNQLRLDDVYVVLRLVRNGGKMIKNI